MASLLLAALLLAGPLIDADTPLVGTVEPEPVVERVEPSSRGGLRPLGDWTITAYTLRGPTRSGVPAGPGICAADPRVLPLGTLIEVEGLGECRVLDTGSAILGRHVDWWMADYRDAIAWGVRQRAVGVVEGER